MLAESILDTDYDKCEKDSYECLYFCLCQCSLIYKLNRFALYSVNLADLGLNNTGSTKNLKLCTWVNVLIIHAEVPCAHEDKCPCHRMVPHYPHILPILVYPPQSLHMHKRARDCFYIGDGGRQKGWGVYKKCWLSAKTFSAEVRTNVSLHLNFRVPSQGTSSWFWCWDPQRSCSAHYPTSSSSLTRMSSRWRCRCVSISRCIYIYIYFKRH